ncbi:MAG: NfeD family protein [Phycisphaerae bacterium]|nr:NfeD family protein [Phycisphaerae bacterium]
MRKLAQQFMKQRWFRWLLRILIPASILGVLKTVGIPFGLSLLLLFMCGVLLFTVPPFNILLAPLWARIFELYGVRDSLPDGSSARPWVKWMIQVFLVSLIVALVIAGFSKPTLTRLIGALMGATILACYLVVWEILWEKPHQYKQSPIDSHPASPALCELVGTEAMTITPLRPVGRIDLNGTIYDAVTEAEFVDEGNRVRIVGCSVGQLKVRLTKDKPGQSGDMQ